MGRLSAALNSEHKFIILCAPTGTGKSFLSKTIGDTAPPCPEPIQTLLRSHSAFNIGTSAGNDYEHEALFNSQPRHGAYILTITKALQDQYLKFFPEAPILKGKVNYVSGIDPQYDVETEQLIMPRRLVRDHQASGKCPYCNARDAVVEGKTGVLNYKMFLSLPEFAKRRSILVCDEAGELEEELVQAFSCNITYNTLDKLGIDYNVLRSSASNASLGWLNALLMSIENRLTRFRATKKMSPSRQFKLKGTQNLKNTISTVCNHWYDCEYVVEKDHQGVMFTPLKVNKLSDYLFNPADKIILQSATIVDHATFAESLGIRKYEYIEVEPTFDPTNSPIYISTKYKLNYKTLTKSLPGIVKQIRTILDEHKDEKGIIHTHSFKITEYIRQHLKDSRLLVRETGVNNETIVQRHISSPDPTVLVSPSLSHGVDLKDDLSRFQVIVKLPYSPLGSKRIKKLFDMNKKWYVSKMMNSLVQASGRSTRGEDDYSVTYILDGSIKNIMSTSGHKFPKHFLDRFM
jgi:hypothetical protein